jgi:hypothetical protein
MKVVKNSCYGGFLLSPKATKRYAELKGKECYFFRSSEKGFIPILDLLELERDLFWIAYSVPNPQDYRLDERDADGLYKSANERAKSIEVEYRPNNRHDPLLIQVIEELGEEASGKLSKLEIVEIPDGVEYEIDQYDGMETIREKHRSW